MNEAAIRVLAPAKVNLTLEVVGLLPGGYHELDTVFAWLDLADELLLAPAEETRLEIEQAETPGPPVGADESNLVLRALRRLEQRLGRALPTRLILRRRIPAGGGLGGGSADAAAALLGLRALHAPDLPTAELFRVAAELGSDVSFGLIGGAARGRGRGEQLTPLPPPPPLEVLLLIPPFPLSTPEVYRAWDELHDPGLRHAGPTRSPTPGAAEAMEAALKAADPSALFRALGNDLEAAAFRLRPELEPLKRALIQAGCGQSLLSGSGSTLFGLVPPGADPDAMVSRLTSLGQITRTRLRSAAR